MGISFFQLLIVFLIILLVFGASRLEGVGSALGKAIRSFKKGMSEEKDESDEDKNSDKKGKNT